MDTVTADLTVRPARALLRSARPRQWVKNLLVLAAPGAAGVLSQPAVAVRSLAGVALFCLAASGSYLVNDANDAAADRLHPEKRSRPVAAGLVSVSLARIAGLGLLVATVAVAVPVGGPDAAILLGCYAGLMIAYNLRLKDVPVVELAVVASGFLLRALMGGAVADVPISQWFLIVTSFGSLFVVAGKRYAELSALGVEGLAHRPVLAAYPAPFLRHVLTVSSSAAVVAYCLWAVGEGSGGGLWPQLSIVPFVLALLRYALQVESGKGGAPEEVLLSDRGLQGLAVAWLVCFAAGVYAG